MKWMLTDPTNEKFVKIPVISLTRRNSSRFISAFIRYSMRKRKLNGDEKHQTSRVPAFTEKTGNTFGGIDSHRARRFFSPLSSEELSAIQVQLAILSDGDGDRPIHIAVANGDVKLVQKLCHLMLKHKISLDITNHLKQTPLHLAVILGNLEIIQLLLNFGASPTIYDRNGNTVLHLCVKSHNDEVVLHHLLSHPQIKRILNAMDYEGYSALHYAVSKKNTNAVKMLKLFGADMNKIDGKSGRTPLIHAVLEQNLVMVELLLNSDACPQKTDYSGRSAYDMAIQLPNKLIIELLEKSMPYYQETTAKEKKTVTHHRAEVKRTKN